MIENAPVGFDQISSSQEVLRFRPKFDMDFVIRLLGAKKGRQVPPSTRKRLDTLRESIGGVISPRLTYEVKKVSSVQKGEVTLAGGVRLQSAKMAHSLKKADAVVLFVATVGEKLDHKVEDLMDRGKLADAYMADALGSGAVEALADTFHRDFGEEVSEHGYQAGLRFSPGYCDWVVSEQEKIFSMIDGEVIGVELGNTSLMSPRKSISALFGLYEQGSAPEIKDKNPCLRCGKKNCIARRASATA